MNASSLRISLLLAALLGALLPAGAEAQTYWRVPTTVGYGGVGLGLGVLSAWNVSLDDEVALFGRILGGLALGTVVGYQVGKRADDALANGSEVSAGHRWGVRSGTVLAGAALGAVVASLIISPEGSSSLGSDEAIFAGSVLTGAVAGGLAQIALDSKLWPPGSLEGSLGVGRDGLAILVHIPR